VIVRHLPHQSLTSKDQVFDVVYFQKDASLIEVLVQKLTDEEKIWMENKNTELEEEGNFDLKPEHLLSFMALRTNFNRNKIESIVKSLFLNKNFN
jgi:hypothetical protein